MKRKKTPNNYQKGFLAYTLLNICFIDITSKALAMRLN